MSRKIEIYEYRDYLQKRYGEILYRVPIDTGGSCPNRNADGSGGCAFCPEDGARAIQLLNIKEIDKQIETGVRFAKRRYKASAFMAYMQTFTSTFTQKETIEQQVELILDTENFKAIAFGTRPDCLSPAVLDYFCTLQKRVDVWVELGIQTSHDQTLISINRGHDWNCSKEAIQALADRGISTAVHLILGLPGESLKDMKATVRAVTQLPIQAIKLHNLHIIKNTTLATVYQDQPFPVYDEHSYCEVLLELLPLIPAHLPIIRLTTDTDEKMLVAPKWNMSKGQFLKFLGKQMRARGVVQGQALRAGNAPVKAAQLVPSPTTVTTDDGSITYYNETIKEHYHTLAGARSEAEKKYILPGKLQKRFENGKVRLLDICFGLGYNSLLSCEECLKTDGEISITALEMDKGVVYRAAQDLDNHNQQLPWRHCLQTLFDKGCWSDQGCSIQLLWGDARHTVTSLTGPFDLIWLDAFSTQRNSELWTVDFFSKLRPLLARDGALLTYCAAIPVRAGLLEAGFAVGETDPFGRERGGTVATIDPKYIERPLPERDQFLLSTSKGTPYRDPAGTRTNREILRAREFEIIEQKKNG
jgi:radical SAM protein (TIGR01212 family)